MQDGHQHKEGCKRATLYLRQPNTNLRPLPNQVTHGQYTKGIQTTSKERNKDNLNLIRKQDELNLEKKIPKGQGELSMGSAWESSTQLKSRHIWNNYT